MTQPITFDFYTAGEAEGETLDREGWTVTQSVWDESGGRLGVSFYYTTPDGVRSPDDYATYADALAAAWEASQL